MNKEYSELIVNIFKSDYYAFYNLAKIIYDSDKLKKILQVIEIDYLQKLIQIIFIDINKTNKSQAEKEKIINAIQPYIIDKIEENFVAEYSEKLHEMLDDIIKNVDKGHVNSYLNDESSILVNIIKERVEGFLLDDLVDYINDFVPGIDISLDDIDTNNILSQIDFDQELVFTFN